jgi:hypothetical protein
VLLQHGVASAAALTGGLQWAMWACGATGLAAIPVAFALIRRQRGERDVLATVPAEDPVTAARYRSRSST